MGKGQPTLFRGKRCQIRQTAVDINVVPKLRRKHGYQAHFDGSALVGASPQAEVGLPPIRDCLGIEISGLLQRFRAQQLVNVGRPLGSMKSVEPLITGFLQNNNYVGRPVDVMNMPDGSMLISDDYNGAVYRLSYGPSEKVAGR